MCSRTGWACSAPTRCGTAKASGPCLNRERRLVTMERNVRPHPSPLPLEREKHSPRWEEMNVSGWSCALVLKLPTGGNCNDHVGMARGVPYGLPLPGGEGRGEGDRLSNFSPGDWISFLP